MQTGDFILVQRKGPVSAIIRLGQKVRKAERPWSAFSHAAFIASPDGDLIEALTRGVSRSRLEDYASVPHAVVSTGLDAHDQAQALAFAESCVGQSYGWLVILGIALRFLTPGRGLWWGMNGTEICSGLVAQALVRGPANFENNPASMTPAELGRAYNVPNPNSEEETMPTVAQVRKYLTLTVLPLVAGVLSNWLIVHVHLLAAFHASRGSVAAAITQLGVFGVTAGLAFLASHHILKGSYPSGGVLGHATLELQPVLGEVKTATPAPPVVVNFHTATPPPTLADAPPAAVAPAPASPVA